MRLARCGPVSGPPTAAATANQGPLATAFESLLSIACGLVAVFVVVVAFQADTFSSRKAVDRGTCSCSCWDKAYKRGHNDEGYKGIYFNLDERLIPLVLWSTFFVTLVTSCLRTAVVAVLGGRIRPQFLLAAAAQIYPCFYGFWCAFNYMNDGGHSFLPEQLVFGVTEGLVLLLTSCCLNGAFALLPDMAWAIVTICVGHAGRWMVDNRILEANVGVQSMLLCDVLVVGLVSATLLHAGATGVAVLSARRLLAAPEDPGLPGVPAQAPQSATYAYTPREAYLGFAAALVVGGAFAAVLGMLTVPTCGVSCGYALWAPSP